MITTLDILYAMRGLLYAPEAWTKGRMARNADGRPVPVNHPRACRLSLEGAMYRVAFIQNARIGPVHELLKSIITPGRYIPLASFNDAEGTTHEAILNLLDKALIKAGGIPPARQIDLDI